MSGQRSDATRTAGVYVNRVNRTHVYAEHTVDTLVLAGGLNFHF